MDSQENFHRTGAYDCRQIKSRYRLSVAIQNYEMTNLDWMNVLRPTHKAIVQQVTDLECPYAQAGSRQRTPQEILDIVLTLCSNLEALWLLTGLGPKLENLKYDTIRNGETQRMSTK